MQSRPHVDRSQRWRIAGVCAFLALITFAVFFQTSHYGFVNLDDDLIVTNNPHVSPGLSLARAAWVFTHFDSFFYTPLTSISHMMDCSMFGLSAGRHHFINVLLHTLSAIALFLVLRNMTGAMWRSAFVAAVFAIHPLHVESVAWISERKDVLSGLFFMLALGAYVYYARRPQSLPRYLAVTLLFTLALLSKPIVLTLPFLFLLLDYWPLGRFESAALSRLIVEKLPLFALSAAASVAAVLAQGEAIQPMRRFSIAARLENAVVSCATYILQMFHPVRLAVFYPHPGDALPAWKVTASLGLLLLITATVLIFRKTHRYLVTGWFWYLAMLAPVAGIVQVGEFARADRFTYLSQIGLYVMATWTAADWCARRRLTPYAPGIVMGVAIAELMAIAWAQTTHWKNSIALWQHTLACTTGNYQAEDSLGAAYYDQRQLDAAVSQFKKSLAINPRYTYALNNLGGAYLEMGKTGDAMREFQQAVDINPRLADARNSLGDAYYKAGRDKDAIAQYEKALEIAPDYVMAQSNLAWMFATSPEDSLRNGARALELAREAYAVAGDANPVVPRTLAAAHAETGDFSSAVETAGRALSVANSQGYVRLAESLQKEIELYRAHTPFRHKNAIPAAETTAAP